MILTTLCSFRYEVFCFSTNLVLPCCPWRVSSTAPAPGIHPTCQQLKGSRAQECRLVSELLPRSLPSVFPDCPGVRVSGVRVSARPGCGGLLLGTAGGGTDHPTISHHSECRSGLRRSDRACRAAADRSGRVGRRAASR